MTFHTSGGGERVRIDSAGYVGINSDAPKARLDVVGTISGSSLTVMNSLASSGTLVIKGDATFDTNTLFVDAAKGDFRVKDPET